MTQLAVIPFSGFYESWHDSELDDALEQTFQDDHGHINQGLLYRSFDIINWKQVHEAYAKEYAETFGSTLDIPSLEFEELWSPREYNFVTDRIFVNISIEDIEKVWDRTGTEVLTKVCEEMFTSRDGFSSFYDPNWKNWAPVIDDWDHNQLFALLTALAQQEGWDENYAMEDARCNGAFDDWVYAAMQEPLRSRLFKVNDYLREREQR